MAWTQGCSKRCEGCANPELWDPCGGREIPDADLADILLQMAERSGLDRITFTGGDPLEQPQSILSVLREIRPAFRDILVYTGYEMDAAREAMGERAFDELGTLADAVIDGPYVAALNDGECALRGSTNQKLQVLNASLQEDYDEAMSRPRAVQNVVFDGRSMSIGIHSA